jgi:hypothetical protein
MEAAGGNHSGFLVKGLDEIDLPRCVPGPWRPAAAALARGMRPILFMARLCSLSLSHLTSSLSLSSPQLLYCLLPHVLECYVGLEEDDLQSMC